jgi:hypothetical protein
MSDETVDQSTNKSCSFEKGRFGLGRDEPLPLCDHDFCFEFQRRTSRFPKELSEIAEAESPMTLGNVVRD